MKITIDSGDCQIIYSVPAPGCRPLVVGTTTRAGMRVKCVDRPRLGWFYAHCIFVEPEYADLQMGHGPLDALVRISRGKRGKYPKAQPSYVFQERGLYVGIDIAEVNRIQRLCDEINRFAKLMRSRKGLRTVAVARMRQKAEHKRQRRERLAIDAFTRWCGCPVGWSQLMRMYAAAGC